MDIVERWIIVSAIDKTFASAQKNLCQSQWQLALRKLGPAGRGTSVPWRKLSDGRENVLSTLPSPTGHMGPSVQRLQQPRAEVSARGVSEEKLICS